MYYVTMTDKFMSGWGKARGKINKLVFSCESMDEAFIVVDNAGNRTDQKYINIRDSRPYYNSKTHYTKYKNKEEYPNWYKKGYFSK